MIESAATVADYPVAKIQAAHRVAAIITIAIASSMLVYVGLVEYLRQAQPDATPVANAGMLRIVFFALAGMVIFGATVTRGLLLRNPPPSPEVRLSRLKTTSMLSAGFAEIPAVFGLVAFLTTRSRGDFYILLVVSFYLIARHFPQRDAWELYVRRGGNAR